MLHGNLNPHVGIFVFKDTKQLPYKHWAPPLPLSKEPHFKGYHPLALRRKLNGNIHWCSMELHGASMELSHPSISATLTKEKRVEPGPLGQLQPSVPSDCYRYNNFIFFLNCCLEFNKCSCVLLIWNINLKSTNKVTQAVQAQRFAKSLQAAN